MAKISTKRPGRVARRPVSYSECTTTELVELCPKELRKELYRRLELEAEELELLGRQGRAAAIERSDKLAIQFAPAGDGLAQEALDYLREHKRYPGYCMLQSRLECMMLRGIVAHNPSYERLRFVERELIITLRNFARSMRNKGLA